MIVCKQQYMHKQVSILKVLSLLGSVQSTSKHNILRIFQKEYAFKRPESISYIETIYILLQAVPLVKVHILFFSMQHAPSHSDDTAKK